MLHLIAVPGFCLIKSNEAQGGAEKGMQNWQIK